MRIAFYVKEVLPWEGSIQALLAVLAEGLSNRAEITVITESVQGGFENAASRYRVVRKPGWKHLAQLFREADVVHLSGPALAPLVLGLLLKKPVVVEHHGFQSACPNGLLFHEPTQLPCPGHFMAGHHGECLRCIGEANWFKTVALWALTFPRRWLCRRAAYNIAPTDWVAQVMHLPRTVTIHHGIQPPNGAVGQTAGGEGFCFVGRLVSTKGAHVLLEAARLLRESGERFELRIIGEGPRLDSLKEQACRSGLQETVRFLGYLPPAELEKELNECLGVIMPSLGGEAFGLVAAESMARGRATVVASLGSLHEVVGDCGLSVPPGDAVALAESMRRLLREPTLVRELRLAGPKRVRQSFLREGMIERHWEVYQRAAGCQ
jgi:glycosyltransferase involved in cell wall biosynthesis